MTLNRLLISIYLILTMFALLICEITTLNLKEIIYSIIFLWVTYVLFFFGWIASKNNENKEVDTVTYPVINIYERKKRYLYLLSIVSILFSMIVTIYYTGQTPQQVITNLTSGVSVYYEYQIHFAQNNLDVFSVTKLPYIFMMFFCKFLMIYSYISIIKYKKKFSILNYVYLLIVTMSYLYIGVARGTNFEIFEWLILLIFTLLSTYSKSIVKLISRIVLIFVISILGVVLFTSNISARGVSLNSNISLDVFYDHESILSNYFPYISISLVKLYDYFGFGFHYISKFIIEIWFEDIESVFKGLFPYGFNYFEMYDLSYQISSLVDMGPRWQPDSIVIFEKLGFLGLLTFSFLMGILSKRITINKEISTYSYMILYVILLEMISLPIGNFITVSSAMKILVVYVIFKVLKEKYFSIKYKQQGKTELKKYRTKY